MYVVYGRTDHKEFSRKWNLDWQSALYKRILIDEVLGQQEENNTDDGDEQCRDVGVFDHGEKVNVCLQNKMTKLNSR